MNHVIAPFGSTFAELHIGSRRVWTFYGSDARDAAHLALAHATDIERFLSFVDFLPSGCWYWTGARSRGRGNKKWYGSFRFKNQTWRAHRFAHDIISQRPCPAGHHRDHMCHFSMCVNPAHLECVTREVNQERKRKCY